MPTGYTAPIADGITFEQYAWSCARAFGALVMMRDEPNDAPIPERFEPSDYHQKKLEEIHGELDRIAAMTPDQLATSASEYYASEHGNYQRLIDRANQMRVSYDAMLARVSAWQAPTPDHVGLKEFMVDQIVQSINHDCDTSYYLEHQAAITRLTGDEWRAERTHALHRNLAYHEKHHREEVERTHKRNEWIKALRDSLAA